VITKYYVDGDIGIHTLQGESYNFLVIFSKKHQKLRNTNDINWTNGF